MILSDPFLPQRDHFEGTEFDLTQGVASGPYGDPSRFDMAAQPDDNLTMTEIIDGGYPRFVYVYCLVLFHYF